MRTKEKILTQCFYTLEFVFIGISDTQILTMCIGKNNTHTFLSRGFAKPTPLFI